MPNARIVLGTAGLADRYGLSVPLDRTNAVDLIRTALDQGFDRFDTAPAYGEAESILGEALDGKGWVATKMTAPDSIANSCHSLRRSSLDLVQIHNATIGVLSGPPIRDDRAGAIGATVYEEAEALQAIRSGWIDWIQVPINLLDRRMAGSVIPEAERAGVKVMARSIFLKGALTERVREFPESLRPVRERAEQLAGRLGTDLRGLPVLALRYALGLGENVFPVVGVNHPDELLPLRKALEEGPLSSEKTADLQLTEPELFNPARWPEEMR